MMPVFQKEVEHSLLKNICVRNVSINICVRKLICFNYNIEILQYKTKYQGLDNQFYHTYKVFLLGFSFRNTIMCDMIYTVFMYITFTWAMALWSSSSSSSTSSSTTTYFTPFHHTYKSLAYTISKILLKSAYS